MPSKLPNMAGHLHQTGHAYVMASTLSPACCSYFTSQMTTPFTQGGLRAWNRSSVSMAFGLQIGCVVNAPDSSACCTKGSPTAAAATFSSSSQILCRKGHSFKSLLNHRATSVISTLNIIVSWTLLNNTRVLQNFATTLPAAHELSRQWKTKCSTLLIMFPLNKSKGEFFVSFSYWGLKPFCRFADRSVHFILAYCQGLSRAQAI